MGGSYQLFHWKGVINYFIGREIINDFIGRGFSTIPLRGVTSYVIGEGLEAISMEGNKQIFHWERLAELYFTGRGLAELYFIGRG